MVKACAELSTLFERTEDIELVNISYYKVTKQSHSGFESRVVTLLDWLLTKAKEFSLAYYLTQSWREEMHSHGICAKVN